MTGYPSWRSHHLTAKDFSHLQDSSSFQNYLYYLCSLSPDDSAILQIDPLTGQYQQYTLKFPPLSNYSLTYFQGKLYIFGGRTSEGYTNTLFQFNLHTRTMVEIKEKGTPPTARGNHSACVWENNLVIVGGYNTKNSQIFDDIYLFSFAKQSWSLLPCGKIFIDPCAPPPLYGHSAIVSNDYLYLFGGSTLDQGQTSDCRGMSDQIYCINLETKAWRRVTAIGDRRCSPRMYHSASLFEEWMVVYGGLSDMKMNDLWCFDLNTFSWWQIPTVGTPPPATFSFLFFS
ncbi:hypothetical protein BLNAU_13596 [Blattamonas nauphoetae]|uniref:Kelch repeat-containing protein n=1 Tax=Blattamonas nauphoetae TaxID=2049346 RepID=A0ABQ9XI95_9EUKA|nr:hypothetical protein BLNAU_13596 [Blattamonas nauphoetae]